MSIFDKGLLQPDYPIDNIEYILSYDTEGQYVIEEFYTSEDAAQRYITLSYDNNVTKLELKRRGY